MLQNITKNWGIMRFTRLAFGIYFIIEGVKTNTWFAIVIGLIFVLLVLFNIGCCSTNNCYTNKSYKKNNTTINKFIYQEVKLKKE